MRILHVTLAMICLILSTNLFGQNQEEAEKLVNEGIAYHDRGEYDAAIARYDLALGLDKDNLLALAEKALTLYTTQKYDEAIACCQKAIEVHPGHENLESVYVAYGNCLDGLKRPQEAIAVYDSGIELFPNFYQLYFNKGVTLSSERKYDESILCFEKSVSLNPKHASSHSAIAQLSLLQKKIIPSILAYTRFYTLEPETARANKNLEYFKVAMKGSAEKSGNNSNTIYLSVDNLSQSMDSSATKENNFTMTELILSILSVTDNDKKVKKMSEPELFESKFNTVCSSLAENLDKNNSGFYWKYYAPFLIEMHQQKLTEAFSNIVYATSGDPKVAKWIDKNEKELSRFFVWSESYVWPSN